MVEVSGEGASIYVIFRLLLTAHNYIAHALIGQSSLYTRRAKEGFKDAPEGCLRQIEMCK